MQVAKAAKVVKVLEQDNLTHNVLVQAVLMVVLVALGLHIRVINKLNVITWLPDHIFIQEKLDMKVRVEVVD